ncbi:MAG TPA: DUF58 domain-containing protein [Candidatus Binataceae bacterium]|nr:DUF58 domain-containing protein [Candidatus Binataceae bacterium]
MLGLPEEFTSDFLARLEQLRIKTRREYAGQGKGSHLSPRRGSSLEFADYRHYTPGDDFRYIDWSLYARSDKLYIKLFKEEEDLLTYIFVDASASMGLPLKDRKFASAITIALALAYVALSSGDRVMVRVLAGSGKKAAPAFVTGRHRIVELARQLGGIGPGGQLDLAPALAGELAALKRAGKVFVVSDFQMMFNSISQAMGLFVASNMDATAVQVLGGGELAADDLEGDVEVIDSETGERLRVSMSRRSREQYRTSLMRLSREIRALCLQRGLHYTLYTTERNFQDFFIRAVTELGMVH